MANEREEVEGGEGREEPGVSSRDPNSHPSSDQPSSDQPEFEAIVTETIEAEPEEVQVRVLQDPSLPSQIEVDDHYARGHLP